MFCRLQSPQDAGAPKFNGIATTANFSEIRGFKPADQQEDSLREDAGLKQPKDVRVHRVALYVCAPPMAADYTTPANLEIRHHSQQWIGF
jgi:hypothetical protein